MSDNNVRIAGISVGYLDPRDLDGVLISSNVTDTSARPSINSALPMYTKDDYADLKVKDLAKHLKELKELKSDVKAIHTALTDEIEYLSDHILPERMEDEGIETQQIKDVGRLQSIDDIRCNVLSENREALHQWLRDNGYGSMVNPDVNSSTLKAFIKDCIANGIEYPTDLVNISPYTRATVVKS